MLAILYDTLVDDDEDVRIHGARVVSLILPNGPSTTTDGPVTHSLSPSSARLRLLEHLSSNYSHSKTLVLEAIWRLTGLSESINAAERIDIIQKTKEAALTNTFGAELQPTPVVVLFERANHPQDVVFEEENPNLYLDPVTEAEAWAQVIIDVNEDARQPNMFAALRYWTWCGLSYLTSVVGAKMDSSLGLTSKGGVYALFMQVVLTARVVLLASVSSSDRKVDLPRGVPADIMDNSWFIKSLRDFYECGQKIDLHPLILDRTRRILEEIGSVIE